MEDIAKEVISPGRDETPQAATISFQTNILNLNVSVTGVLKQQGLSLPLWLVFDTGM